MVGFEVRDSIRAYRRTIGHLPMQNSDGLPCAICGSGTDLIQGRSGRSCRKCIGAAAARMIERSLSSNGPMTASDRCLLCGDHVVSNGNIAAFTGSYRICFGCVRDVLDSSNEMSSGAMAQVPLSGA